jgi:rhodanese-related sulfurtransferase
MKKFLAIMMVAMMLMLIGCSESTDDAEPINEFQVLLNHLENSDANYEGWVNTMSGWIKDLSAINTGDYFVLDIRGAADYDGMHIAGAVNSTMGEMFDKVADATKPILVVCYSGQSASYAHMLLRMKGHEAYVLKWGMSIYDESLDKWTGKCSNQFANHNNWVKEAAPSKPTYEFPALSTGKETAEEILNDRIDAAVAAWSTRLVSATDIVPSATDYNVICYWSATDYETYGCIKGAYQITPNTLKSTDNLQVFDPAGDNVFYCWTGQTAAASIAYLYVLGYDVKSIAFASNNMIYDELTGHKWPKPYGK